MSTAELATRLPKPDLRTRHARAAMAYMKLKGYLNKPFAVAEIPGDDCWYYYFEIPSRNEPGVLDLLELEVSLSIQDDLDGEFRRRVTLFRQGT